MTIPTEKQFQEEVRRLAAAAVWMCYHQYSSLKSPAGFPDLVLVRGPVLLAVELKMPGKAPTEAQKQWLDALRSVRQVSASVWTPDDLATILEVLR
jgi:hypothetical protein